MFGFLGALRNMKARDSFAVFFMFSVLFGLCFTAFEGKTEEHMGDANAYRMRFEQYKHFSSTDVDFFIEEFKGQYDEVNNHRSRDIYVMLMAYIASRISDNYHVFFALLAMVMATFQLLSFRFLVREKAFRNTIVCFFLAWFFIRGNGIFNINTCRFWTASWIAIYCNFQIFRNGKIEYYLLALLTPLIHVSYWFYLGILLIIYFFSKYRVFWKVALFVSFIASNIAVQIVSDMSSYLPPVLQGMVEMYTSDIEVKNNLFQVLLRFFKIVEQGYLLYIMYLFISNEKYILKDNRARRIYEFLLVWLSVIFFVMPVPTLGTRFLLLAFPMIAYLWLVVFEERRMYRKVIVLFPLFFIMSLYNTAYAYFFTGIEVEFWYSSPLYLIYKYLLVGTA